MKCIGKIKNLFYYLLNVKKINDKVITNINNYNKVYEKDEFLSNKYCIVNNFNSKDWSITINKKAGRLYDELFKYYMDSTESNCRKELVLGQAILSWKNKKEILHPMFITPLKIEYNMEKESIYINSANKTYMEIGIYDFIDSDKFHDILKIREQFKDSDINPNNNDEIKSIVYNILCKLGCNKKLKSLTKIDKIKDIDINDEINIYDCPVIIMRKKDDSLWSLEINSIIDEIENGYNIPETVKALVQEKEIEQDENTKREWEQTSKNILFPLPANEEQISVAKKIADNYGVVVQGPPGTGKSHTIANLICHFLAHGKRVLVTSETSRALRVLSDKIPKEIKPLCINLLDSEKDDFDQLEDSIKVILENLSKPSEELLEEIRILEKEINKSRVEQESILEKLREIEFLESKKINHNGQYYKLIHIGKWVRDNESKYGFIKDSIRYDEIQPITDKQFYKIVELFKNNHKDYLLKLNELIATMDKLPSYEKIRDNMQRLIYLNKNFDLYKSNLKSWYIPSENKCNYTTLVNFLSKAKKDMLNLQKNETFKKIYHLYNSSDIFKQALNNAIIYFESYFERLKTIRKSTDNYFVKIPDHIELDTLCKDYEKVYNNIKLKGRVSKFFKVLHGKYEYILKECTVNNKNIDTLEEAEVLKNYIEEQKIFVSLNRLWENVSSNYFPTKSLGKINNPVELEDLINNLNIIINWNKEYKDKIILLLGKIRIPTDINWYEVKTYDYLMQSIKYIKHIEEHNDLKAYMEVLKKYIFNRQEMNELLEGIEEMNLLKIKHAYIYIQKIKACKSDIDEINYIYKKLSSICPKTLKYIVEGKNLNNMDSFSKAWRWAQYNSIFITLDNLDEGELLLELEDEKNNEQLLIREMVAKRSWYNRILNITEAQKRSLLSWGQAVKRIGKGRGKFTLEYSKIAQEEMEKCKSVIPVWIMPLNKIIENMKLSKDLFDVVIVDESSQSNIFSICALMRAKKAVVVGDDKQISPEVVGVDQGSINNLINKYLKGIPHSQWLDLQSSLYDTALRVFQGRVALKEHFRSIPEIVEFSNRLCYSDFIVPLRYPRNNEVLNPCINAIKVDEGYREKNKQINIKEANSLVDKVVECCKNKRYKNMTMGVISLLGDSQSDYIENILRDKLGEEEIIKRRLTCGDAYSFQGDERDVMFLSMVVADNVKYTALTKESDIRRFNVAASRARNQLFLFYSVDVSNLSKNCVRYKLINYCNNYKKYKAELPNVDYVAQTRLQKDVYNEIKEGYDVKTQIKIGKYKIDFVIEGAGGRLAIICDDGNLYNNNSLDDMVKFQMDLCRLGWRFYKIKGSQFYRNPNREINKLLHVIKSTVLDISHKELLQDKLKVV
ncbi:DNA helicase [Clostridium niameyense]|uniref:DNA helicase n=1 Tax=Clostridium niameyense TaxID=1622073 RepID=A0A6M0RAT8_9CLOT|nr:AAA domain-containing protein [Clostridium niameyense]NEZ47381.1 DNA helicase [Clostridium niameyense]